VQRGKQNVNINAEVEARHVRLLRVDHQSHAFLLGECRKLMQAAVHAASVTNCLRRKVRTRVQILHIFQLLRAQTWQLSVFGQQLSQQEQRMAAATRRVRLSEKTI
jgi:hypothetical protein